MSELKPCAFCGGEAVFGTRLYTTNDGERSKMVFARCASCGVKSQESYGGAWYEKLEGELDKTETIASWNTRTPDPIADKLAGALNEIAADDYRMADSCALYELLDDKISIAKQALSEYQAMKGDV